MFLGELIIGNRTSWTLLLTLLLVLCRGRACQRLTEVCITEDAYRDVGRRLTQDVVSEEVCFVV